MYNIFKMKVTEIFISGGLPTITYNPRLHLDLENKLVDFIETGNKLISITGPTKSGKTVLCTKLIPQENCVFLSGGTITSESDFWESILTELGVGIDQSSTVAVTKSTEKSAENEGGIDIKILKLGAKIGDKESFTNEESKTTIKIKNLKLIALKNLQTLNVALLIDDFHYIEPELQKKIIRALKQPIFLGLRVIILAVPHRAFDALRVENEMTGRVVQLPIPLWSIEELEEIAIKGFEKLNVACEKQIINRLANESYGSPHLMQEFCLRLCKLNNINQTVEGQDIVIPAPEYERFFNDIVKTISSKVAFERLAKGPRQRADRVQRELSNGETVDIYTATLHGIAETGPKTEISYEELRTSLRKVLADNIPQGHEITRVLAKMDEIAKEELHGEPVIDWDKENTRLYISDPFFAFYLKWAVRS